MLFVINGREYLLQSINSEVDNGFIALHKAYFHNGTYNFDDLKAISLRYFDSISNFQNKYELHNNFFNNFTIIWNSFLARRDYGKSEWIWELCIDLAHQWESDNSDFRIHKGTPFYFWGMTAILRGDLDKGYVLMHNALQEDIETTGLKSPNTPSLKFVIADYSSDEQAFSDWPKIQATYINKRISLYNNNFFKDFSLDKFWKSLLLSDLEKGIIYQFAHYISKFYDISRKPRYIYKGDFACQLIQDLLFDLARIVDAVIYQKHKSEKYLKQHIQFISDQLNFGLDSNKIQEINGKFRDSGFGPTLLSILDNEFQFEDQSNLDQNTKCLAILYGIRNHGAHNVVSSPVITDRYDEIELNIFFALFLIVENFYLIA